MMTSYIWHCFCTYCTKCVYYISALSCHTAPVGHNSVLSKTKSIRPRLRPRPKLQDQDQDRGRSETGLVIRPRSQTQDWKDLIHTDDPDEALENINLVIQQTAETTLGTVRKTKKPWITEATLKLADKKGDAKGKRMQSENHKQLETSV